MMNMTPGNTNAQKDTVRCADAFRVIHRDAGTRARAGLLTTRRGVVETPFFMPVATNATIKALPCSDFLSMGGEILLSNTYHLYIRPGMEVIARHGGLHEFMRWDKPILPDSGGYQVFSLARFRKIKDEGVSFQSHIDGSSHFFTPEDIITIQGALGSDIMMPLDECADIPATENRPRWHCRGPHSGRSDRKNSSVHGRIRPSCCSALYKDRHIKICASVPPRILCLSVSTATPSAE